MFQFSFVEKKDMNTHETIVTSFNGTWDSDPMYKWLTFFLGLLFELHICSFSLSYFYFDNKTSIPVLTQLQNRLYNNFAFTLRSISRGNMGGFPIPQN